MAPMINELWTFPSIFGAQLSQALKLQHGQYMEHYRKLKNTQRYIRISSLSSLPPRHEWYMANYTNQHLNDLRTNRHNKTIHAILSTLKAHRLHIASLYVVMVSTTFNISITKLPLGYYFVLAIPSNAFAIIKCTRVQAW